MRSKRRDIAIVIDEYGGTAGLVTLDNLLEALVGSIDTGPAIDAASAGQRIESDGFLLLDGLLRVDEFVEVAELRLDDDATEGVEPLGGVIPALLGRFPEVGEEIRIGDRTLRIEPRTGLRVATLRLLPAGSAGTQPR